MLPGLLASIIESVGDYYACERLSGAPRPPKYAINLGIGVEGIGCLLNGLWGSGIGTSSFSNNIGAIAITKVRSPYYSIQVSWTNRFLLPSEIHRYQSNPGASYLAF